ncbi:sulfonate ABC transporter substrate-binding protein [Sphaerisporangium album]|uniref:Sulfonate ABC transporter substrate-binding protein n=1 Tax=Sphaerisporangium album TaxID=509200 RepID=A0A367EZG1_9ACTN|nr:ABC transporter substrate-binding protein [Sphaerisporangium album]RCG23411.1 sulfonate ABC transporter substrate-binding protein [Sphaerisporangium album]
MTIRIGVHNGNPSLFFLARLEHVLDTFDEPLELYFYGDGTRTARLLAEGTIDIGGTGSTPPLIAQADGLPLVYVAASAPRPGHGALVTAVPGPDGGVHTVADLRGKPVAFAEGSWHTHFLAELLDGAGLAYQDVEPRAPGPKTADLLRKGEVAAWVAQGADLVRAEASPDLVVLAGTAGVVPDRSVFFTRPDFAATRPRAVAALAGALRQADEWVKANPREAAHLAEEALGGSVDAWEVALARFPWRLEPITPRFLDEQQEAADILYAQNLLRRPIDVSEAANPDLAPVVAEALTAVAGRGETPADKRRVRIGSARSRSRRGMNAAVAHRSQRA